MKWTQEQRDKAALEVELAYLVMPLTQDWPAERVKAIAVDLACQRNELLEALKNLASLAKDSIPDAEDWHDYHHALLAIAKAEGK